MNNATQFLIEHSTPVLFGVVLLEQAGLPLPAMPWLLAAGALAASGRLDPIQAIVVTVLACLLADSAWFYVGRRNGKQVLRLLCRMSVEPKCCIGRSEGFLARHAAKGLLGAKFLPWLGMVIPPLAGTIGMSYRRFLAFDAVGSALYSSAGVALGFIFSEQLHQGVAWLKGFGVGASALVLSLILGYIVFKIIKWRHRGSGAKTKGTGVEKLAAGTFPKGEATESASIVDGENRIGVGHEEATRQVPRLNSDTVAAEALG